MRDTQDLPFCPKGYREVVSGKHAVELLTQLAHTFLGPPPPCQCIFDLQKGQPLSVWDIGRGCPLFGERFHCIRVIIKIPLANSQCVGVFTLMVAS